MVTLQTDFGQFSAETPEQATKEAKKAERAAKKAEKEREENRKHADTLARAEGWRVLSRYIEHPDKAPCGWRFYRTGTQYGPSCHSDYSTGKNTGTFSCEGGEAKATWYLDKILGHVWNAAGFTMVVAIQDNYNGKVYLFATAVYNGAMGFAELPIPLEWFPVSRAETESEESD